MSYDPRRMTEGPAQPPSSPVGSDPRWGGLREEILVFLACAAGAVAIVQGGGRLPVVGAHAQELAELLFLLVPFLIVEKRGGRIEDYGFHLLRAWRSVAFALVPMLIVFPPFVLGFAWWWNPPHAFLFERLPDGYWNIALAQFLVVALPEEALFRGYLQTRLERRLPSRSWHGIPVGWAIPLTSAAFALLHFVVIPAPARLAVFFPSLLFGVLRHWTGSLVAPILFHGASNVLGDALYFGYMT